MVKAVFIFLQSELFPTPLNEKPSFGHAIFMIMHVAMPWFLITNLIHTYIAICT